MQVQLWDLTRKAWELLDQDNVQVFNSTRRAGRKTKAAGSKEWKGVTGDEPEKDTRFETQPCLS